jgi:hypothetical protein
MIIYKKMRRLLLSLLILTQYLLPAFSQQDTSNLVRYTSDFRFKEGFFVNFEQVQKNEPIPKARVVTSTDYNSRDFFKNVVENDRIYFFDALGLRQEIEVSSLWGYSRNGILYRQLQGNFHRITFVGKICHYVADITTYDRGYNGGYPYGYYDPYYYSRYNSYNYYSPYGYNSPYRTTARNELKQYIIDFDTGREVEYEPKNVELMIMNDPELYDEYLQLSRKKKKQMAFYFIRKYNEKHPLYLPKN